MRLSFSQASKRRNVEEKQETKRQKNLKDRQREIKKRQRPEREFNVMSGSQSCHVMFVCELISREKKAVDLSNLINMICPFYF